MHTAVKVYLLNQLPQPMVPFTAVAAATAVTAAATHQTAQSCQTTVAAAAAAVTVAASLLLLVLRLLCFIGRCQVLLKHLRFLGLVSQERELLQHRMPESGGARRSKRRLGSRG